VSHAFTRTAVVCAHSWQSVHPLSQYHTAKSSKQPSDSPSSRHVSATSIASSKVGMRRTSPSLVTDSPMPHQNYKLSTSISAPTLARVCALTFPDDSCVSHALAILHSRLRPLCRWCISPPASTCSPPSPPTPSRTVARAMLYIPSATRYPARAPTHNRPYTDDSGVTSVGLRPGHLGWCETEDARVEVRGATRWRDTFALCALLRSQVQAVDPGDGGSGTRAQDWETLNVTFVQGCYNAVFISAFVTVDV